MVEAVVIDYGVGNLLSVSRALEHCGAHATVSSDPAVILAADRVILPGVGAFANGMAALCASGLDRVVRQVAAAGTPLLGICLGMQMLMESSDEFGATDGLGLIAGKVVQIPGRTSTGEPQKIPHIGWNELVLPDGRNTWDGSLLADISPGEAVYFVHSYMAQPSDPLHRIADCRYGGVPIAATIAHNNVCGCQFHPEKSGEVGLRILRSFLEAGPRSRHGAGIDRR